MVEFNEEKQDQKLAKIRKDEEEALTKLLAERYGVGYADLSRVSIDTDALRILSEDVARESRVAIFRVLGKKLHLAILSPKSPATQKIIHELEEQGYMVSSYMVSSISLNSLWAHYAELSFAKSTEAGLLSLSTEKMGALLEKIKVFKDVEDLIQRASKSKKTYRITRLTEILIAGAAALDASDVHLEPEQEYVRIRYRLDGILNEISTFDIPTYQRVLSRIKLLSGVKVNVQGSAQDGRITIRIADKDIEIRTSILPGTYADSVVMRLLDPSSISVPIEDLGFSEYTLSIIQEQIKKPNGMLLNTGPTGSGKTTSLYAFLKHVHTSKIKIITIENPIEYHLPGIVQTQTNKEYTFANGLRAALRQDPDVIMVGEIRDNETATIAVNAALTGHLVFSTLHTNNAAGTFSRLIDLGINPKILASSINVVMAQRLVRKLCEHCKTKRSLEGEQKELIEKVIATIYRKEAIPEKRDEIWEPGQCEKCNSIGFKGRLSVVEAILMDDAVDKIIRMSPSEREIWEVARPQGILSMQQEGVVKVLNGITSLEELQRVIDLTELVEVKDDATKEKTDIGMSDTWQTPTFAENIFPSPNPQPAEPAQDQEQKTAPEKVKNDAEEVEDNKEENPETEEPKMVDIDSPAFKSLK